MYKVGIECNSGHVFWTSMDFLTFDLALKCLVEIRNLIKSPIVIIDGDGKTVLRKGVDLRYGQEKGRI